MFKSTRRKAGVVAAALAAVAVAGGAMAPAASATTAPTLCTQPYLALGNGCDTGDTMLWSGTTIPDSSVFQFQFRSGSNITWWKGFRIEDSTGKVLASDYTQDGKHSTGVFTIPANNTNLKLVISKAKAFGAHTDIVQIPLTKLWEHNNLYRGGEKLDFVWYSD